MIAKDTRIILLEAAEQVVTRDGVGCLTLDSVAREARVSKGGLLYHFPSKRHLIEGLILHQMDVFEARVADELAHEPQEAGRWLRAYIRVASQPWTSPSYSAGIIASLATEPDLLALYRQRFEAWREKMTEDGVDTTTAALIHLALDGWRLWRTFQLTPQSDTIQEEIVAHLMELTRSGQKQG